MDGLALGNVPFDPVEEADKLLGMRKFKQSTQRNYLRSVELFTRFLGRSPDTADPEDLRNYQLYLDEQDTSSSRMNAHISALKFFFGTTLDRPSAMRKMRRIHTGAFDSTATIGLRARQYNC